jgi:hypothetical protein
MAETGDVGYVAAMGRSLPLTDDDVAEAVRRRLMADAGAPPDDVKVWESENEDREPVVWAYATYRSMPDGLDLRGRLQSAFKLQTEFRDLGDERSVHLIILEESAVDAA